VSGKSELENQPGYLLDTIDQGYDVETDIWFNDEWWLGHDRPVYQIDEKFIILIKDSAWFHAKNKEALDHLAKLGTNAFMHDQEPYAMTTFGYKWSHNGLSNPEGIVCMPDLQHEGHLLLDCKGVCHYDLVAVKKILTP
jgi:hypothetical protein